MKLMYLILVSVCFQKLVLADIHLVPPPGSQFVQVLNLAGFPPCGSSVGSHAVGNDTAVGCKASDGIHAFEALQGGNNGGDALQLWLNICHAGLRPSDFKASCFGKSNDSFLGIPSPQPGAKLWGSGKLASCNKIPSANQCSDDSSAAHLGCVARVANPNDPNKADFVLAMTPGDNCKASIELNHKVCAIGIDAREAFSVACYVMENPSGEVIVPQPPTPAPALQPTGLSCKDSGDGYYFLLYDNSKNQFVDKYKVKTKSACQKVLAGSGRGLTCKSGSNGEHAIYDYVNNKSIDNFYARTIDECLEGIRINHKELMCQVDDAGYAAIKLIKGGFIDTYFSKTVSQCNLIINSSRESLTCVSSEDVGGKLGLWNFRTGKMIDGKDWLTFAQCLKELR